MYHLHSPFFDLSSLPDVPKKHGPPQWLLIADFGPQQFDMRVGGRCWIEVLNDI